MIKHQTIMQNGNLEWNLKQNRDRIGMEAKVEKLEKQVSELE